MEENIEPNPIAEPMVPPLQTRTSLSNKSPLLVACDKTINTVILQEFFPLKYQMNFQMMFKFGRPEKL